MSRVIAGSVSRGPNLYTSIFVCYHLSLPNATPSEKIYCQENTTTPPWNYGLWKGGTCEGFVEHTTRVVTYSSLDKIFTITRSSILHCLEMDRMQLLLGHNLVSLSDCLLQDSPEGCIFSLVIFYQTTPCSQLSLSLSKTVKP